MKWDKRETQNEYPVDGAGTNADDKLNDEAKLWWQWLTQDTIKLHKGDVEKDELALQIK